MGRPRPADGRSGPSAVAWARRGPVLEPAKRELSPTLAVLVSAVLWGTLWIPLRHVRGLDPEGALRVAAGFLLPLVVLVPLVLARGSRAAAPLLREGRAGFWLALGVALYAEGLVRGQVARVILLFYLTPIWSTLLARILLSEPIPARRVLAIGLGLAGMLVIFGPGTGATGPGDLLGLAAGIAWAFAAVEARRRPAAPLLDRTLVHFLLLGPLFLAAAALPGSPAPSGAAPWGGGPWLWLAPFAALWMLPVVLLTLFGAARLDPGRYAMLLMLEVVVGLASSTLLIAEPFTLREALGAALILTAITVELRPTPLPAS